MAEREAQASGTTVAEAQKQMTTLLEQRMRAQLYSEHERTAAATHLQRWVSGTLSRTQAASPRAPPEDTDVSTPRTENNVNVVLPPNWSTATDPDSVRAMQRTQPTSL